MFYYDESVSGNPLVMSGKYRVMNGQVFYRRLLLECVDCVKWPLLVCIGTSNKFTEQQYRDYKFYWMRKNLTFDRCLKT